MTLDTKNLKAPKHLYTQKGRKSVQVDLINLEVIKTVLKLKHKQRTNGSL